MICPSPHSDLFRLPCNRSWINSWFQSQKCSGVRKPWENEKRQFQIDKFTCTISLDSYIVYFDILCRSYSLVSVCVWMYLYIYIYTYIIILIYIYTYNHHLYVRFLYGYTCFSRYCRRCCWMWICPTVCWMKHLLTLGLLGGKKWLVPTPTVPRQNPAKQDESRCLLFDRVRFWNCNLQPVHDCLEGMMSMELAQFLWISIPVWISSRLIVNMQKGELHPVAWMGCGWGSLCRSNFVAPALDEAMGLVRFTISSHLRPFVILMNSCCDRWMPVPPYSPNNPHSILLWLAAYTFPKKKQPFVHIFTTITIINVVIYSASPRRRGRQWSATFSPGSP